MSNQGEKWAITTVCVQKAEAPRSKATMVVNVATGPSYFQPMLRPDAQDDLAQRCPKERSFAGPKLPNQPIA